MRPVFVPLVWCEPDQPLVGRDLSRTSPGLHTQPGPRGVEAQLCPAQGLLCGVQSHVLSPVPATGHGKPRSFRFSVASSCEYCILGWFWFLSCIILHNLFKDGGLSHLALDPGAFGGLTEWQGLKERSSSYPDFLSGGTSLLAL
uniref:Uncharacterized protein n=1 Tax=Molossus molossus TaxID=27622 RepID=A0A7J8C8I4_MOLMO|nr:hypothetical protein HJG59_009867 [Molossus molossus]